VKHKDHKAAEMKKEAKKVAAMAEMMEPTMLSIQPEE
jgi:hypothetical protein